MTFDKPMIHNLAAEMLWRTAETVGVPEANRLVLESEGAFLLEQDYAEDLWQAFPVRSLPDAEARAVLSAVAAEAYTYARDEENMQGSIYLEDRDAGRSPSAAGIDCAGLAIVPTCVYTSPAERLGRLCLRHPLPAVVFAPRAPYGPLIEVADTETALGFAMPMFLMVTGVHAIDAASVVLMGYFMIPAPSHQHGALWDRVIQNSQRVTEAMHFGGDLKISFTWPEDEAGDEPE